METRFSVRKVSSPAPGMANVPENRELNVDPGATNGYVNQGFLTEGLDLAGFQKPESRRGSFVHHTLEALPRVDNYRLGVSALKRPSIGELRGEERTKDQSDTEAAGKDEHGGGHGVKLGWIQGVLIPCLLNIWGVMLFLRLAWVVGQAGIGQTLAIILISAVVCVVTTTSMSAICTNGEVKGGGVYYIISRSLGPEFGASIGIVFAFANTVAASMNTIGFCNSLNDLLKENGVKIVDGGDNDVRIIGTVAIFIMILVCAVGMEWESKAQNFLIAIIVVAIVDFIGGAIRGPISDDQRAQGFNGLSLDVFEKNWDSSYRFSEGVDQNFFSVFAIFFPSVTGIQAGANISGDLKDPAHAIPLGTMLALLISMLSYGTFVVFAGGSAYRDANGVVADLANGTYLNCHGDCQYGLANSYTVMQMMSLFGPLIYAGCFAATLSTALTNLLSVPRLIQAIGIDRIYPGLIFFSKGYGKGNEAYRGYALTFVISVAFLLIAQLNIIAPLISNFYLVSYALINFCTFHAALIKPLGWRPTFRFYNVWVSLLGFVMCVGIMFLIDWITSLVTIIIMFALYLIVVYRKPDVNWGSSTQAQTYKTALASAQRLSNVSEHVKNYRPQVLVLSGKPCARPALLDLAYLITKNNSLLMCGEVCDKKLSYKTRQHRIRSSYAWMRDRKIKGFYTLVDGSEFEEGARGLLQATGVGKLRPNVLMMGYKADWKDCSEDRLAAYFNILQEAFSTRLAVAILRLPDGLDYSSITDEDELLASVNGDTTHEGSNNNLSHSDSVGSIPRADSNQALGFLPVDSPAMTRRYIISEKDPKDFIKNKKKAYVDKLYEKFDADLELSVIQPAASSENEQPDSQIFITVPALRTLSITGKTVEPQVLQAITMFESKQNGGNIDVWWLYDDGGLTILLPYIISIRQNWANCKLRIFALANRKQELQLEQRNMASLLSKFRIDYSSLTMIEDVTSPPKADTCKMFENLIEGFTEGRGSDRGNIVSNEELAALQDKTNRHLRLREFLQQHSHDSKLVVMSLPMPRKDMVSAPLYMAWLEVLTRDMPPFLLVRGNHSSVLTFYS